MQQGHKQHDYLIICRSLWANILWRLPLLQSLSQVQGGEP